ncbi:hypothetical protein BN1050_00642 [Metalysinibacillus saudimassiliensis]|uniref:Uncharacterized protein n=1 Tax=Metalysinibacillus saudimassiliensis TaxID=1461583 RepID=A0A078LZI0_9BACL|nr:hypothetical protein BN1050_00642 [Metalysinibacillus saudimassiliensis]
MSIYDNEALKAIIKQQELFESSMPSSLRKIAEQQSSIQSILDSGAFKYVTEFANTAQDMGLNNNQWKTLKETAAAITSNNSFTDIVRQQEGMFEDLKKQVSLFDSVNFTQLVNSKGAMKDLTLTLEGFTIDEILREVKDIEVNNELSGVPATITVSDIKEKDTGVLRGNLEILIKRYGKSILSVVFFCISVFIILNFSLAAENLEGLDILELINEWKGLLSEKTKSEKKKTYIATTKQDFFLRAGKTKSAPLIHPDKILKDQQVEVVGSKGKWIKIQVQVGEGSLTGWTQRYTITRVHTK